MAPAIEITRIRNDDLPDLARLYRQLQPSEQSVAAMTATLAKIGGDPRHVLLAARVEGRLVGSLLGVACQMLYGRCRSFMVVEDVVVDEDWRRHGIGRSLMQTIERHARELDCSYIILLTDADRVESRAFYTALGYNSDPYTGFKKRL
jgi:GNAT superfamily N-acetyltransferase